MHRARPASDAWLPDGARDPVVALFVPGLEELPPPPAGPRLPALERLLGRGRRRALPEAEGPWAELARLAGGDVARWPVGPVSRLGDLGTLPAAACLRVEPLGLEPSGSGIARTRAVALAIRDDEARGLAAAFAAHFAGDGLALDVARPERWYLSGGPGWSGFALPPHADLPPGPPESALRRLLGEGEMLLHAHPVNECRRESGRVCINSLHPWGGGAVAGAGPTAMPAGAGDEPYLRGLRSLAGAAIGRDLEAGGIAWPLAVESLTVDGFRRLEDEWAAPLYRRLVRGRLSAIRVITGRGVHEVRVWEARRAWRRPRPVTELC
jgi:hypothetical protein